MSKKKLIKNQNIEEKLKEAEWKIKTLELEKTYLIEFIRKKHPKEAMREALVMESNRKYSIVYPPEIERNKKYFLTEEEKEEFISEEIEVMKINISLALNRHFEKGEGRIHLKIIRKLLKEFFWSRGFPKLERRHKWILKSVLIENGYEMTLDNKGLLVNGIITYLSPDIQNK